MAFFLINLIRHHGQLKTKHLLIDALINDSIDGSIIHLIYLPANYCIIEETQIITLYLNIVIVHRIKLEAVKWEHSKWL